jgi:hypothetical protein
MNTRTSLMAAVAVAMTATNVLAPRAQASQQSAEVIVEWNTFQIRNRCEPSQLLAGCR